MQGTCRFVTSDPRTGAILNAAVGTPAPLGIHGIPDLPPESDLQALADGLQEISIGSGKTFEEVTAETIRLGLERLRERRSPELSEVAAKLGKSLEDTAALAVKIGLDILKGHGTL